MKKSRRWVRGIFALAGLAWLGCAVSAPEGAGEVYSRSLHLEGEEAGALADTADPGDASSETGAHDDGSVDPSACNCIFFTPGALASCAREQLFCNSTGDCVCDLEREAQLAAARRSPPATERTVESRARALPPPPSGCTCLAGTPSPPEGGCEPEDWYCKPSGSCRCDN